MINTILFDLDDTLLGNNMDSFLPAYFALLGEHASRYLPRDQFMAALQTATDAVVNNVDPTCSNREVFWHHFEQCTGLDTREVEPYLNQFYVNQFHQLEAKTEKRPFAAKLIHYCQNAGVDVVIATTPLFPRVAIEVRLAWAGLPVDQVNFDLITAYENMHAAKPQPAYYAEILAAINGVPEKVLMVGDDWENDIAPAASLGIHTFWLAPADTPRPSNLATYRGTSLQDLYVLLAAGWQPVG